MVAAALALLASAPAVAHAHDGTIIVLWFGLYGLFMAVVAAVAITVFVVARLRTGQLIRESARRRALIGALLGFPVSAVVLYVCVVSAVASSRSGPGPEMVFVVMACALLLQVGYIVLICRWIGRARVPVD